MNDKLEKFIRVITILGMSYLFIALSILAFYASRSTTMRLLSVSGILIAFAVFLYGSRQRPKKVVIGSSDKNSQTRQSLTSESMEEKRRSEHLNILVVDDDKEQANNLRELILNLPDFKKLNPAVDVVDSVEEMVKKLQEKEYAIGISDLHCPDYEDGIEVIKYLRTHNAKGVMLTSAQEMSGRMTSKIKDDLLPVNSPDLAMRKPINEEDYPRLEGWLMSMSNLHVTPA